MIDRMKLPLRPQSREDWLAWLEADCEFAEERLLTAGVVNTLWVLHRPDGKLITYEVTFSDAEHRRLVINFMTLACIANDVAGISMIFEAWLTETADPEEAERINAGKAPMPSERIDRQEVLSVQLLYRDGNERRLIGGISLINRDAAGRAVAVTRLSLGGAGSVADMTGGALLDVMLEHKPQPEQIAKAQEIMARMGGQMIVGLGIK
jgi:hypothetical protein